MLLSTSNIERGRVMEADAGMVLQRMEDLTHEAWATRTFLQVLSRGPEVFVLFAAGGAATEETAPRRTRFRSRNSLGDLNLCTRN